MKTTKIINVNGTRFALPDTMSAKDVQALIGFLATLQTVDSRYDYSVSEYLYDLGRYPEVRIEDIKLTPDARAKHEESYKAYQAKRDAEKAAA